MSGEQPQSTAMHQPRLWLAVALGFDAMQYGFGIGFVAQVASERGSALPAFLGPLAGPWHWLLVLAVWAGCLVFARGRSTLRAGAVMLGAMALLSYVHAAQFGSPWRHLFHSGGCVLGWMAGAAWARRSGAQASEAEAAASWGALGVLGAAYTSAGVSKFLFGGQAWASGLTLQAALLGQMGDAANGWRGALRAWCLAQPLAVQALTWGTLVWELAGLGLLGPAWLRRVVGVGLAAMHLTIFALTEIGYPTSMFLLLTLGWRGASAAALPVALGSIPPSTRWATGALLALATAGGMAWQRQRYMDHAAEGEGQPQASRPPSLDGAAQVGPFAVGQRLHDWELAGFAARERALGLRLRRGDQQAMLWLHCGPGQPTLGDGHARGDWPLDAGSVAAWADWTRNQLVAQQTLPQACAIWQRWMRDAAPAAASAPHNSR